MLTRSKHGVGGPTWQLVVLDIDVYLQDDSLETPLWYCTTGDMWEVVRLYIQESMSPVSKLEMPLYLNSKVSNNSVRVR